jgi:hypothetical protein
MFRIGKPWILPAFLLAVVPALCAGCEQMIGLSRDYPPILDAATDSDADGQTEPDMDGYEAGESNCEIAPYRNLTETEDLMSWDLAVDFLDMGSMGKFGVVWRWGDENEGDMRFSCVSVDGERLDVPALEITTEDKSFFPDIAAADDGFGIMWQEDTLDGADADYELRYTYVNDNGTLLVSDPYPNIPSPGAGLALQAAIAWNGEGRRFGCAWQDSRSEQNEIYFTSINKIGVMPDDPVAVTSGPGQSTAPDLAWSGSEYGLVWVNDQTGRGGIYFARLGTLGDIVGPAAPIFLSEGAAGYPKISAADDGFGVIWSDTAGDQYTIFFMRLGWNGSPLTPEPVAITSLTSSVKRYPDIHFSSSQSLFHVCWEDNRVSTNFDIFAASIFPGVLKTTFEARVPDSGRASSQCAVTRGRQNTAVFWSETTGSGEKDVFFSIFSCTP